MCISPLSYFPFPFSCREYSAGQEWTWTGYLCLCAGVCVHVDEGICAWKQDEMRNSGLSAVAVVFVTRGGASH